MRSVRWSYLPRCISALTRRLNHRRRARFTRPFTRACNGRTPVSSAHVCIYTELKVYNRAKERERESRVCAVANGNIESRLTSGSARTRCVSICEAASFSFSPRARCRRRCCFFVLCMCVFILQGADRSSPFFRCAALGTTNAETVGGKSLMPQCVL